MINNRFNVVYHLLGLVKKLFTLKNKIMEYKLTRKCQLNKRGKDNKSRSYLIYFLNGVEILKQKLPFEEDYDLGFQHHTGIENEYLLNGKIYQTRSKLSETRDVSFPVSKNKLNKLGFPNDFKLELSK